VADIVERNGDCALEKIEGYETGCEVRGDGTSQRALGKILVF
jgi:hypothetical protein